MNYSEIYKECRDRLNNAEIPDAEVDIRLLFEYIIGKDRNFLFLHGNEEISNDELCKLNKAIDKRVKRIPLQHITGVQEFMGLTFDVNEHVLIPRFDTEVLVEELLKEICDGAKVLDVCTGSGCILISIMKYRNDIEGFGIDISEKALETAKANAKKLDVSPEFIQSDLFDEVTEKGFDYIISNPPYIRSDVIKDLMTEVKDHDPLIALDGGQDGLVFYRRIAKEAKKHLKIGGRLFLEIGNDQGNDVKQILSDNGYKNINIIKDYAGNDRVVTAG